MTQATPRAALLPLPVGHGWWSLWLVAVSAFADGNTADQALTASQIFLAGASAAQITARSAKTAADGTTTTIAVFDVGATITIQRILERRWSKRTKYILAALNVAAGGALSFFAVRNVRKLPRPQPVTCGIQ